MSANTRATGQVRDTTRIAAPATTPQQPHNTTTPAGVTPSTPARRSSAANGVVPVRGRVRGSGSITAIHTNSRPIPMERPMSTPTSDLRRVEDPGEIDTGLGVPLGPCRDARHAPDLTVVGREHRLTLDQVVLDPPGDRDDLLDSPLTVGVDRQMGDEVHR